VRVMPDWPAVAAAGGVPRAWCLLLPGRGAVPAGQLGGEGLQAGDRGGDLGGPGPLFGKPQPQAATAGGEAAGDGEEPKAQALGFPAAGVCGQGEHLGPGEQFAGQGDDLAPELVLGEALSGRFRSPVSFAQRIRSSHLARRRWRSSMSASWPFFASVAKAVKRWPSMSVNRSCAPGCGRSLRTMTRIIGLRGNTRLAQASRKPLRTAV
jgi:hypothetical protein